MWGPYWCVKKVNNLSQQSPGTKLEVGEMPRPLLGAVSEGGVGPETKLWCFDAVKPETRAGKVVLRITAKGRKNAKPGDPDWVSESSSLSHHQSLWGRALLAAVITAHGWLPRLRGNEDSHKQASTTCIKQGEPSESPLSRECWPLQVYFRSLLLFQELMLCSSKTPFLVRTCSSTSTNHAAQDWNAHFPVENSFKHRVRKP